MGSDIVPLTGAIAIILSAIVSLLAGSARWQAIEEGRAKVNELRELTGIRSIETLQNLFGPPTLDGIYRVTRDQIRSAARPEGRLIADTRIDIMCILIAVIALFVHYPLINLALVLTGFCQLAGWILVWNFANIED